jgi:hypothetical protein
MSGLIAENLLAGDRLALNCAMLILIVSHHARSHVVTLPASLQRT